MYPTFSDLLYDLLGVHIPLPIQTFGLMMLVSFFLAWVVLSSELGRRQKLGVIPELKVTEQKGVQAPQWHYALQGFIGFFVGGKLLEMVLHYSDLVQNPQAFILSWRLNAVGGVGGLAVALWMHYREQSRIAKEPKQTVERILPRQELAATIILLGAAYGLLGAKLFHNLENIDELVADPLGALFSFSGLTFYGGLIVATFGIWLYARKRGLYFPWLMDSTAPALMLGYASGRLGCQLAGDGDWGIVNTAPKPDWLSALPDWVWAYRYPHNVLSEGVPIEGCQGAHCFQLAQPVFPTPLYECLMALALFGLLWLLRIRIRPTLGLFFVYLLVNGIERFLIELIRVNSTYNIFGGITQAQIISTLFILIGSFGLVYVYKNPKRFGYAIP
jgi:prolipoprotein diacylglyceryltransferase